MCLSDAFWDPCDGVMENKQPTLLEGFFKGLLNNAVKDNKIDCDLVAAAYIFRHGMMAIECRGVLHRHQTGEVYPSSTRIGMEYQVPIESDHGLWASPTQQNARSSGSTRSTPAPSVQGN